MMLQSRKDFRCPVRVTSRRPQEAQGLLLKSSSLRSRPTAYGPQADISASQGVAGRRYLLSAGGGGGESALASLYRLGRLLISPRGYISKCDVSHNLGGPCRGNFSHDRNPEGPQVSRFGGRSRYGCLRSSDVLRADLKQLTCSFFIPEVLRNHAPNGTCNGTWRHIVGSYLSGFDQRFDRFRRSNGLITARMFLFETRA